MSEQLITAIIRISLPISFISLHAVVLLCYCNDELSVKAAQTVSLPHEHLPAPVRALFSQHRFLMPVSHEIYSRYGIIPIKYYIVYCSFHYDICIRQRWLSDGYTIMTDSFRFPGSDVSPFLVSGIIPIQVTYQMLFPIEAISRSIRYRPSPVSPASASLSRMDLNSFSSSCCSATYHCRKLKVG